MVINCAKTVDVVRNAVNSGKNIMGINPRVKVNFNEVDKFLYLSPPLKNPATGNAVATMPCDLPPLKDGWVRLIHRTQPEVTGGILNEGLRGKYGISGTTTSHSSEGFWKNLETDNATFHGSKKVVMDMPAKEHKKLYHGDLYYEKGSLVDVSGYSNAKKLYVKNKYIVGIMDAYGSTKHMTPRQLSSMKKTSDLNPFLEIRPEDLRQLNQGRPINRDFQGRTPAEAKKHAAKLEKELAKRQAETINTANLKETGWDIDGWD